jgi:hypothetical protein
LLFGSSPFNRFLCNIVTSDKTWTYAFEFESKRQSAQWLFPVDPRPVKLKRFWSIGKKMIAFFFSTSGPVSTIVLENPRTVNAKQLHVCENCSLRRPRSGTVLHKNASLKLLNEQSTFWVILE